METITLRAGPYRLIVTPEGGGVLAFSVAQAGGWVDIFRPASPEPSGPLDRAMIVMAPWCNRIGGNGFHAGSRFRHIAPNVAGFAMPLHGNAFQSLWEVVDRHTDRLKLGLHSNGPGDFNYRARLTYDLSATALSVELCVGNTGPEAMPFGIGLHPWFAADASSRLQFTATGQLLNDVAGLPIQVSRIVDDFSAPRPLPPARIDNTFLGWSGTALLTRPEFTVQMQSTAPFLHVFSPSADADFCCLEPQTAIPNASNFAAMPRTSLGAGDQLSVKMTISVEVECGSPGATAPAP